MRVAVVGGVGYVGVNVVPRLAGAGHEVVVVARRSSIEKRPLLKRELERSGARIASFPALDSKTLAGLGADVYVHMAGAVDRPKHALWEAHVGLAESIVNAAVAVGARVVYTSAVAAVGRLPGAGPGSPVYDGDPSSTRGVPESYYEETKARGEDVVAGARGLGGKWSILRPGMVVGRHMTHPEWRALRALLRLGVAPVMGWEAPFAHRDDLAEAYLAAVEGRLDGVAVHVVSWHSDLWDLASRACEAAGKRCRPLRWGLVLKLAGPLAPGVSRLKMAYLMYRRGYRYESRYLPKLGLPKATVDEGGRLLAEEMGLKP